MLAQGSTGLEFDVDEKLEVEVEVEGEEVRRRLVAGNAQMGGLVGCLTPSPLDPFAYVDWLSQFFVSTSGVAGRCGREMGRGRFHMKRKR